MQEVSAGLVVENKSLSVAIWGDLVTQPKEAKPSSRAPVQSGISQKTPGSAFRGGITGLLVVVAVAWACGAKAMPTCQGTFAATLLQPLPAQIVVDIDILDRSPRNLMLAGRFLTGVRDAGVAVGTKPSVLLHVSTARLTVMIPRHSQS